MRALLLLKGGQVVEAGAREPRRADVLLEGRRLLAVAPGQELPAGAREWDIPGWLVFPGLVDAHTHLREPGFAHKETVAAGTRGAAAGGFTAVVAMPNVNPAPDTPERLEAVLEILGRDGVIRTHAMGCITREQRGREVADIAALADSGAVAVSDDGHGVQEAAVAREALRRCARAGIPLVEHCEDNTLSAGGLINEGEISRRLGIRGLPRTAEEVMLARDILLAAETGAHLHVAHISSERSLELVSWARDRGYRVTAEVTPHHLVLCDEDVAELGAMGKMKPPLTTTRDREALCQGLARGVIDIIATDHAPHTLEEKGRGLADAPFGIAALETALGVVYTNLVHGGYLGPNDLARCLSAAPARLLGLDGGRLEAGAPADLALVDPEAEWVVDRATFRARGRNTPFQGQRLRGRVMATICAGEVVYRAGEADSENTGGR